MSKKAPTPQPVVVTTICSECGIDWARHGKDPTTADCIRLLKQDLALAQAYRPPVVVPAPYPVYPMVRPWRYESWTTSAPHVLCGGVTPNAGSFQCYNGDDTSCINVSMAPRQNASIECRAVEVSSAA